MNFIYFCRYIIFRFDKENLEIKKNVRKQYTFFIYKYNLFNIAYNFT